MKKRTFIKLSSALLTGSMMQKPLALFAQDNKLTNWAGNLQYSTTNVESPASVEVVQQYVKANEKFKALGTKHCFNKIADSKDAFVSTKNLNKVVEINSTQKTVTVEGGIRYGAFAEELATAGFALHNLASLPHISVAGACATATHGSGIKNGNLSTAVVALEIVKPNGEVVELSKQRDVNSFYGAVVNLGALGIVTKVTLHTQPTFNVRQDVYENLAFDKLKDHFNDIMGAGYSVSLFTDWQNKNVSEVWVKSIVEPGKTFSLGKDFYGATAATKNIHPIVALSAENCTEQMGVPGAWYERLPHFKMGFTPSSGKELQSEFFVPLEHAYEAISAVEKLHEHITPNLLITEIRTINGDDLWMSPCYKQPSAAIHFTWKPDWASVSKVLPLIEAQLAPFNARPHWGKLFTMQPAKLKSKYENLSKFQELVKDYDPEGKLHNDFLKTYVL